MNLIDLKLIIRNLVKNKTCTLINIIGLTIGLTACLYMIILLRHEDCDLKRWVFEKSLRYE